MIGGVHCHISAKYYLHGQVSGHVSSALNSKKYHFQFERLKSLQKKDIIIAEVQRLYWDYYPKLGNKRGPNGESGIVLCYKSEKDCDPFDYNFLDK